MSDARFSDAQRAAAAISELGFSPDKIDAVKA